MLFELLLPVLILGGLGAMFGVGLSMAANIFEVKEDERVTRVRAALVGANCGACGFPGCDGLASAIVAGEAPVSACPVGGASVAEKIGEIMGVKAETGDAKVAILACQGNCEHAGNKAIYVGVKSCDEAMIASGGPKKCSYGCMGYGTCVSACLFDAMTLNSKGLPEIDTEKCTACGKCKTACPKGLIDLLPKKKTVRINCKSQDKGKLVKANCSVGCIGCKTCVKACTRDAIIVENNLARIDYEKCVSCGDCIEKCPTEAITRKPRRKRAAKKKAIGA